MAKVIKLTDDSNVTLLPITDASYVQISYAGIVKSVSETILENEEITAAALNDLDMRIRDLETVVQQLLNSSSQS